jgi:hypothetical protein
LSSRCNILPDPQFSGLKPALATRLEGVAALVSPDNFASLLDPLMHEVLRCGFTEAGASEGTVWLLDSPSLHLVPGYNSGPNADKLVGKFRQPLSAGLICMVFASEQPFLENGVHLNARQSKLADTMLQVQTFALIAVPFYFLRRCRGVVSAVQLKASKSPGPNPPGFSPCDLTAIQRAASILTRLMEYRLLSRVVDWAD